MLQNKFPRTPHLLNLGAATSDDKVLSIAEANLFWTASQVVVEEKIDGANSALYFEGNSLLIQNRSHVLSGGDHPQFNLLKSWAYSLSMQLQQVLGDNLILYGEWMYAQHSIKYNKLPGFFIAFDVYDRKEKIFLPTSGRDQICRSLSIPQVPILYSGSINQKKILQMVNGPSCFSSYPREGIYLRVQDKHKLLARAKIVSAQFANQIDEHWQKKSLRLNTLT